MTQTIASTSFQRPSIGQRNSSALCPDIRFISTRHGSTSQWRPGNCKVSPTFMPLISVWVTDFGGQLLSDPMKYILDDPEGEERWNLRLKDALARAEKATKPIFHGYTFYVTRSVQPSFETLKKVAVSAGGKVSFCCPLCISRANP